MGLRRAVYIVGVAMLALGSSVLHAREFTGEVTHVSDGDTLWVRAAGAAPQAVRLHGLDAPEHCQPYGREARAALAGKVLGRRVRVHTQARDDFERTVAKVRLGDLDVNAWLVEAGHAWAAGWRRDPGPYAALQAQAQQARRGLWAASRPEAPREFRRRHGPCPRRDSGLEKRARVR